MIRLHIVLLVALLVSCTSVQEENAIDASTKGLVLVNGVLELEGRPFTGKLLSWYSDQILKSEIVYKEGKKHGSEKYWFENGELAQERYYVDGLKSGIHKAWWGPDRPKFVYHFNNQGAFHGEVKEWYRSGQLYMSFNYNHGKENGSQRLWKMDGTIKANYEVVNGERFGLIGLKKCNGVRDPLSKSLVNN